MASTVPPTGKKEYMGDVLECSDNNALGLE